MAKCRNSAFTWISALSWLTDTGAEAVLRQKGRVVADMHSGEKSEVIRRLIQLFEVMNVDEALTMFTENAQYRFGNYPPAVGREGIRAAATASHLEAIKGCRFNIQGLWEFGDVVVCEMEIEYIRTDDSVLTLPCTDVFRMEGNLIKDMRIYMDPSPLFA